MALVGGAAVIACQGSETSSDAGPTDAKVEHRADAPTSCEGSAPEGEVCASTCYMLSDTMGPDASPLQPYKCLTFCDKLEAGAAVGTETNCYYADGGFNGVCNLTLTGDGGEEVIC
jgi:hypothetical protein